MKSYKLRNINMNQVGSFLAGLGIGLAASMLLTPAAGEKTRGRIRDIANRAGNAFKDQAESLGDAAGDILEKGKRSLQKDGSQAAHDLKDKINDATDTARKTADQVADKSRDLAHSAGRKIEEGGKHLQNA